MQRLVPVFVLVVLAALAVFFSSRTRLTGPAPNDPSGPAVPGRWATSWWPMAPGCMWRYQVTGAGEMRSRAYYVEALDGDVARVLENTNGKQSDTVRVRLGEDGALEFREYQAADEQVKYIPPGLEVGTRWQLKKDLRAVAVAEEDLEVPALGGPRTAMRVEYEAHYSGPSIESPGWYADGTRWFVAGVGMVREDLEEASGPPAMKEVVARKRRHLELVEFRAPWLPVKPRPTDGGPRE